MQVKTSCQHWGGTKVSKRRVVIVLCIKVKYYKSLKRSLYQSLKRRNDILIIDNVGASILCSLALQWKSLSLDILKHILMSWLFKLVPTFLKALLQLIKASIKCNCSLSEPRRICNIFFSSILVTEVSHWWARNVSTVATTILKSLVDVEMYYMLHHYIKLCGHYRDCL